MANPIKKCVLHGAVNNETVDLYPRTNLASVSDMTAFARTLNGAADAAAARNTLGITTQAALVNIIYPVGSVITLTNDTDPNKIYSGTTWVKMDAGRVLVSAGTYTEGSDTYTYALGSKGGEAKHQLTVEELPAHSHGISITADGNHSHTMTLQNYCYNKATSNHGWGGDDFANGTYTNNTSSNGYHSHSAVANNTGGNTKHENRTPYVVVQMWVRTI